MSTLKPAPITPSQSKTGSHSDASHAKTPTSAQPKTPSTRLFAPTAASFVPDQNGSGAIPIGMEGIVIKAEAPPVIDTTEGAILWLCLIISFIAATL